MSLLATVNGRGVLSSRPAAAAANEGYLYYATDSGSGSLFRSNGSSWDAYSSGGLADQGTATYLDFTTAAAPASPSAGKIRVYSKTGDTLAQKTSGGTETVFGAGGGGGITQAYVGYNTIGGSTENLTANRVYAKSVTLANDCLITNISAYLSNGGVQVDSFPSVQVYTDSAGAVGTLIHASPLLNTTDGFYLAGVARWMSLPCGLWVAAGTYWIALQWSSDVSGTPTIAYDGSGSDRTFTPGGTWVQDGGTQTNSTRKFSIRANTIR